MGIVKDIRQSSRLSLMVAAAAATLGIIYGYDSSNIAGALLFITDEFTLSVAQQQTVTTAVVIGEIFGALFAGALSNRIGRKWTMVLVAVTYAAFSLLSGLAWAVPVLIGARFLLGITIGVSVVVVPVYVAESAPAKVRGAFLVLYQVATVVGIILGYLIAWALAAGENWRWMLAAAFIPGVVITLLLVKLPDTARWYAMRGRYDDARRTLERVEPDAVLVEKELAEMRQANESTTKNDWRALLRKPYLRASVFVVGLGFFVQITGINAIVYYSPRIFEAMGFTGNAALLGLPALVQVAGLLAVFVSFSVIDRMGRRPVLLTGIGIMVAANALLVATFLAGDDFGGFRTVLGFVGLILFTVGFTFGFGSLVWVYAGESMPSHLRSLGASAMLTANLMANAAVAAIFLTLLTQLGGAGTFVVFGALAAAAFVFVHRLAPETKNRPLEDISEFWENGGSWPHELVAAGAADAAGTAGAPRAAGTDRTDRTGGAE
ncbi:sugar porter family MFS transporter [Zhihengliuella sp.]|uniref:sugar porter family MFS transporter n=1 Tax=Zhihengliuella sp. TaxID=1954483 RepID=UPI002810BB0A|nr:sugar porter family MFS transporter [Zhihengliuella sp.]